MSYLFRQLGRQDCRSPLHIPCPAPEGEYLSGPLDIARSQSRQTTAGFRGSSYTLPQPPIQLDPNRDSPVVRNRTMQSEVVLQGEIVAVEAPPPSQCRAKSYSRGSSGGGGAASGPTSIRSAATACILSARTCCDAAGRAADRPGPGSGRHDARFSISTTSERAKGYG